MPHIDQFEQHRSQRDLVSIRRGGIDDHSIQGFILAASDQLVLLQYLYDFNLDGLRMLRSADITEVGCSLTDRFQRKLLVQEGLLQQVPFETAIDVRNWKTAIAQLLRAYSFFIVECERGDDPDFCIGRIGRAADDAVEITFFSGSGEWSKQPERIRYEDMTCCQVDTNYIKVYQHYFERNGF